MSTPPLPPPPQGQAPEDRPYGNYAAPTVESDPGVPPPVYMAARPLLGQVPSYSFAVDEPPPPYILPKDVEQGTPKIGMTHRMRWSRTAATVAIIMTAAAVIAGGLYGYHQGI